MMHQNLHSGRAGDALEPELLPPCFLDSLVAIHPNMPAPPLLLGEPLLAVESTLCAMPISGVSDHKEHTRTRAHSGAVMVCHVPLTCRGFESMGMLSWLVELVIQRHCQRHHLLWCCCQPRRPSVAAGSSLRPWSPCVHRCERAAHQAQTCALLSCSLWYDDCRPPQPGVVRRLHPPLLPVCSRTTSRGVRLGWKRYIARDSLNNSLLEQHAVETSPSPVPRCAPQAPRAPFALS